MGDSLNVTGTYTYNIAKKMFNYTRLIHLCVQISYYYWQQIATSVIYGTKIIYKNIKTSIIYWFIVQHNYWDQCSLYWQMSLCDVPIYYLAFEGNTQLYIQICINYCKY